MGQESVGGWIEQATPEFATMEHSALVDAFWDTEGDPGVCRELSLRIFRHAGYTGDPSAAPLVGRDGAQVQQDGQPLTLADYISYATNHHFEAIDAIFDFLDMTPGDQDYEAVRAGMINRLNPGRN